jgi:hypothetical protein
METLAIPMELPVVVLEITPATAGGVMVMTMAQNVEHVVKLHHLGHLHKPHLLPFSQQKKLA